MHADTLILQAARRLSFALLCAASLAHAQPVGPTHSTKDQTRPSPAAGATLIDPAVARVVGKFPMRLDCERVAPTEFPDQYYGILVTNRGPHVIAAGRQVRWDVAGAPPQGGVFTLAQTLPVGKGVVPVAAQTHPGGDKACTARLTP